MPLCKFRSHKIQGFHGAIARHCAGFRQQLGGLGLVSQILKDGRHLGQHFTFFYFKRRHVAFAIHLLKVTARFSLVGTKVNFFKIKFLAEFMQDDVRGE